MERRRVLVKWAAGPSWRRGESVRKQPGWEEHAAFIDDLVERGIFVMGGPLRDNSGSLALLDGVDLDEARRIVLEDPFSANGVFVLDEILDWTIFVDELSGRDGDPARQGRAKTRRIRGD
jgi:uncharacterized protein